MISERGFTLASLLVFMTAATILMAAEVPVYRMQARRAQEEELLFRGEEYIRAIQKYQRKFKTYPVSIDALLNTNGIRFLRKAYTDPITGKPFRMIYINPDGSLTGSTIFKQMAGTSLQPPNVSNTVAAQFYRQQVAQAQQSNRQPATAAWVIGVAPTSEAKSVKLYNGRGFYNEWEFIAILQPAHAHTPFFIGR